MSLLRNKDKRNKLRHELYDTLGTTGGDIGETIKSLRTILSKDQQEFCDIVGIGLATLRKIEQDRGNVTVATLNKIFEKFSLRLVVTTTHKQRKGLSQNGS